VCFVRFCSYPLVMATDRLSLVRKLNDDIEAKRMQIAKKTEEVLVRKPFSWFAIAIVGLTWLACQKPTADSHRSPQRGVR
jgi:hypothetical protein